MYINVTYYDLTFFMLLSCHFLAAQSATGTVVDAENQEPIIGASILEKGTNNGTITDFDGHFELNLTTEDPVLVISYVGFQSQEAEYTGEELFIELTGGLAQIGRASCRERVSMSVVDV